MRGNVQQNAPIIYWVRRDLRLSDNPALRAAAEQGRPVLPVFIRDAAVDRLGAAPKWRLGLGLEQFDQALQGVGSRLTFRSGAALETLHALIKESGADAVFWAREYDPKSVQRDSAIKGKLKDLGINARSFGGKLLHEPWSVETKTGGYYKVYTPFWNAVKNRDIPAPLPGVVKLQAPANFPPSENLSGWSLGSGMQRGAAVVRPYVRLGEEAAQTRLADFCQSDIASYNRLRDVPAVLGTSGLSENLAVGEISPYQCWHAGLRALQDGKEGAETFLKEIVWREFAYHLMHHTPHILDQNWKPGWDRFPWNKDEQNPAVLAWKQGRTGMPFVDAAMREMYVTGRMHNRGRMIVASFLTKHLMTDWRIGLRWFESCLIDWDAASNAMGWQWSAGSGPDATPYFRVFNPETQLAKFDPKTLYQRQWLAEGSSAPSRTASLYFEAIPKSWNLSADLAYPNPVISLAEGRQRALDNYKNRDF